MSFLTKGGKLIRKDGKLVKTDDPSKCPCCGAPQCCLICEAVPDENGKCPDGFYLVNGMCSKPIPNDCSLQQELDAANECLAAGGQNAGNIQGPCPPPPPPSCQPAPDCQDAFNSKAQCDGKPEAWVNCSNNDCTANDFQEAKCLDGLPEALESQGWNVVVRNEQCCECGPTGSADGTQLMNVYACCDGTADGLVANFIYIPRNEDDPCQWCTGLSGVEATFKDGKPVWSIQRCTPPPPPPPCPPGQVEKWFPPDCGPGPCVPVCVDGDINPCEGFPYDCESEGSCNGWLDAHPNAPCPPPPECCLLCESVPDADGKCPDGFDLVSGMCSKLIPNDCSLQQDWDAANECLAAGGQVAGNVSGPCPEPPPPPPCITAADAGVWQLELCDEEDCGFPVCGDSPPNGVGRRFATRKECEDCHRDAGTCNKEHPLCWENNSKAPQDNPLP